MSGSVVDEITTVGVVGWGRMGAEMGRWLCARDWPVIAYDPTEEASIRIANCGATVAGSVVEVGRAADLVLIVVVDDAQVTEIISGPEGLLAAARPGSIAAVCSSVRPDTCQNLAALAASQQVAVVDVALVGGERAAELGSLTLMCGGDSAALDRCMSPFAAFAKDVCVVGGPGAGQVAKSANNILMWANLRASMEVLTLAKQLGVAPARLRAILNAGTGANQVMADWGLHRMRWPKKDLEVALALADDAGVEMPLVRALQPLMESVSVDDMTRLR